MKKCIKIAIIKVSHSKPSALLTKSGSMTSKQGWGAEAGCFWLLGAGAT